MPASATFYLEPSLRQSAEAGEHNFIARMTRVLTDAGLTVRYRPAEEAGQDPDTLALTHMAPPPPGGLTFRRVYHYPFWQIESSAERWHWTVAETAFSPGSVPDGEARRFYDFWRNRLFGEAARNPIRGGSVYVPLQGRLLDHRSFQSCAPVEMLRLVLAANPDAPVTAGLHPNESYSEAELAALDTLMAQHDRLSVQLGGMEAALQACDHVVTMNSSAAFSGYFFGKPCVIFGRIDFHHIALTATPADTGALARIRDHRPDFASYVWWFWQHMSINAGRPEAEEKIRAAMIRGGWPLG